MAYRLLDPLARQRNFQLMEGGPLDLIRAKKSDSTVKRFGKFMARGSLEGGLIAKDLIMGGKADSTLGGLLSWNKKTTWIDRAQDVVDIIGIIDPTGVADAANALGYAARGKWGAAAVSALGVIPYVGDAGKIAKWGVRAAKVAKVAGKAAKVGKAEGRLAKAAKALARESKGFSRASKGVGRGAVHGAERAAVRGAESGAERGLARRAFDFARGTKRGRRAEVLGKRTLGRYGRSGLKMLSGEGKLRGKAAKVGEFASRAQNFRRSDAGQRVEKNIRAGFGGQEQPDYDPNADLGRRCTGVLPKAPPPPSLAPPGPGSLAWEREAEQPARPNRGRGGSSKGSGGATEVPVDADCPGTEGTKNRPSKTTTWKATPGMKRCNKQSPESIKTH